MYEEVDQVFSIFIYKFKLSQVYLFQVYFQSLHCRLNRFAKL